MELQGSMMSQWWKGAVVYQVYVRSFFDSNGDGQGDLAGVEAKLDYIKALGVDAIWLSPIHPSPNLDWGYDIADYDRVQHDYGSLADFDRLLASAHALGIRIMLDEVLAHTSDQHPWFADSVARGERADWYVWADGAPDGGPPNNWLSSFGGPAWTWSEARGQFYHHKFMPQQPKLNWLNAGARASAFGVLDFWLARGVDGFRLDVAGALAHDPDLGDNDTAPDGRQIHRHDANRPGNIALLDEVRRLVERHGPDRFVLGEFFEEPDLAGGFAAPDEGVHSAYTFPLLLNDVLGPAFVRDHFEGVLAAHPDHWPSVAFSNHDVKRAPTRFGGAEASPELARLLLALLLCLRGTVLLYQGEELGLPQAYVPPGKRRDPIQAVNRLDVGRDGSRTPMPWDDGLNLGFSSGEPWLPAAPEHAGLAARAQSGDPASTLNLTRRLIALRRIASPLRLGALRFIDAPEPVLAFEREHLGERLLCEFNLGSNPAPAFRPAAGVTLVEQAGGVGPYGFRIARL